MPVPWLSIPWTELVKAPPAIQQSAEISQRIDEYLTISARRSVYDPQTQTYVFSEGVTATYDVTTVKADRLEIHMAEGEQWAKASGNVQILDPEAEIHAEDLEFTWKPLNRSGKAKNVSIRVGHAHVKAATADIKPDLWTFERVEVTNCPEYYWVHSPRVVVVPGHRGKLEDPTLYVFGKRIMSFPDRSFNLDPRTQGINLPSLSYRRGQGLGVAWDAGLLLNDHTNLYMTAGAFPRAYPSLGVTVTRSSVPADKASAILTPSSELGERFRFGYLDNIEIRKPQDETRFLRTERNSISVDSLWNAGVTGRDYETSVSKAIEGVYERGGVAGGKLAKVKDENGKERQELQGAFGYLAQVRLQTIRERGGSFVTRSLLTGTIEAPPIGIGHGLSTLIRVDAQNFLGSKQYGWTRGLAGLVFEPNERFRVAGGFYGAVEYGTPQFRFDRLVGERGLEIRADANFGATKVSYLQKYDTKLKWYDREYLVSQVAGCFEPYLLYRKFPQTYTLGVRFRLDDFYDLISRRQFARTKSKTTVISAPHGH